MQWEHVSIEREGRLAIVRFDRGDGRNPLSGQLLRELTEAARSFEDDLGTSCVILSGAGPNFSVGFDLKDPIATERLSAGLDRRRQLSAYGARMCRAWEEIPAFTIAAIEGWCIGGGTALAVALDFRVAARDATFYVPEISRGMNMSWQSIPRFVSLIGPARAKQLAIMAEKVPADEARRWGLVEELAEPGAAMALARTYAAKVTDKPPVPVRMIKQGATQAANALGHAVSYMDADQFALAQTGADYREGVASFLEKRPPNYTGD
ncbi:enoyl-CoA hydratase/isomerase family protein [Oceanibacterium hippocampi]|uniref:Putative enoyl-CoA hydratase echA8 n=1 Tax=Oceanibacterium hippocampi TaxID=745714 RepID=A0A1Y5STA0_9PROT|nr:enoyl-CoA hydratase/isomerase family protein [Oceanibacterium hippocampi]SLN44633.1 putative enoyl-CoA hydratase echA8 [Oceanibacterium hippocampi]